MKREAKAGCLTPQTCMAPQAVQSPVQCKELCRSERCLAPHPTLSALPVGRWRPEATLTGLPPLLATRWGLSESILSLGFFVRKRKAPMPPHTDVAGVEGGAEFNKITSVYTAFDSNT